MNSPAHYPLQQHLLIYRELKNPINFQPPLPQHLLQHLRLFTRPREPIKEDSVVAGRLPKFALDEVHDELVRDQFATFHEGFSSPAKASTL